MPRKKTVTHVGIRLSFTIRQGFPGSVHCHLEHDSTKIAGHALCGKLFQHQGVIFESIEFNAGTDDPMESVMLHVRGDNKALDAIKKICDYSGWRALDCSLGDFIRFDRNPDEGFSKWRAYRDKVLGNTNAKKSGRRWQFWK